MASRGKSARNKGNSYERQVVKEFKEMGWTKASTSRYSSKENDDNKVDLCNVNPFNIQCKAVEGSVKYLEVLASMPVGDNINCIFRKRNREKQLVILTKDDFYKLIKDYIKGDK